MFDMFVEEYSSCNIKTTYQTYGKVFRSLNLSFHHPKKDVCGLCVAFREGDNEKKAKLQEEYARHIEEKVEVRRKKELAKFDPQNSTAALTFDLQQVIMLPKSNENKVFYKRRLSNYNFTIYNLKTKQCVCFLWHEGLSKRGASEISTCLYHQLKVLDAQGIEKVILFADGCTGQNKNSVVASMLLHSVCSLKNLKCISLSFFVSCHGQNEGDSAHSAITSAMNKAAEIMVPSQLIPVCRLARKKNPYSVHALATEDFLDFKSLATDLRLLSVRQDDDGNTLDWTKMYEFKVEKSTPNKLYFKDTHLTETYRAIT
nr:unnamed protein product [Callosobruchus chinensis]